MHVIFTFDQRSVIVHGAYMHIMIPRTLIIFSTHTQFFATVVVILRRQILVQFHRWLGFE